jgi:hypothetical protein
MRVTSIREREGDTERSIKEFDGLSGKGDSGGWRFNAMQFTLGKTLATRRICRIAAKSMVCGLSIPSDRRLVIAGSPVAPHRHSATDS